MPNSGGPEGTKGALIAGISSGHIREVTDSIPDEPIQERTNRPPLRIPGSNEELYKRLHEMTHPDQPPAILVFHEDLLSQSANRIRTHVRDLVGGLDSRFPAGLRLPDHIFFATGEPVTDERQQPRMKIALLSRVGVITFVAATLDEKQEPILDNSSPLPATDLDIRRYALPLLGVMDRRLENVMLPEAIRENDLPRREAIVNDIRKITVAKIAIGDELAKPITQPQPAK